MDLNSSIFLSFDAPLHEALFLERPNRFIIRCQLKDNDTIVNAHLTDPGRLKDILIPGRKVWLRYVDAPSRKTAWSTVLSETEQGTSLLSLDATLPNRLVERALKAGALPEWDGYAYVRREYSYEGSRWDFLLENHDHKQMLLEIKSVTLADGKRALFPNAVTKRGAHHVETLARIAQEKEHVAALLFVIQRDDVTSLEPARHIDPAFAKALEAAKASGVQIHARKTKLSLEGITLTTPVPVNI